MTEIPEKSETVCIICNEASGSGLTKISSHSLEVIKTYAKAWTDLCLRTCVNERVKDILYSEDIPLKYHRSCYASLTNKANLERAQVKYDQELKNGIEARRRGRPSSSASTETSTIEVKRRKKCEENLCIFCQVDIPDSKVYSVTSADMGNRFIQIKKYSRSEAVRARLVYLKDDVDAFAQNMKYHLNCLRIETRNLEYLQRPQIQSQNIIQHAVCDIEIAAIVKERVVPSDGSEGQSMDMKEIEEVYKSLLTEKNAEFNSSSNLRKHIKRVLIDKISHVVEISNSVGPKPAIVMSKATKSIVLSEYHERDDVPEEMECLLKASNIVRQELLAHPEWSFKGSFTDFEAPLKLQQLVYWILVGVRETIDLCSQTETKTACQNISQFIHSALQTNRQVQYKTKKTSGLKKKSKQTPINVGSALMCYKTNRSRAEVDALHRLGLSITYDEVRRITTGMAISIAKEAESNQLGLYLPSFTMKGVRPIFAADNIDVGSDAGSFHGADLMIVQRKSDAPLLMKRENLVSSGQKHRSLSKAFGITYLECSEQTKKPTMSFSVISMCDSSKYCREFEEQTNMWLLLCSISLQKLYPEINKPDNNFETIVDEEENDTILDSDEDEPNIYDEFRHDSSSVAVGQESAVHSAEDNAANNVLIKEKTHIMNAITTDVPADPNENKPLSWSAFNSLIFEPGPVCETGVVAPLYTRSPTEWPVLYTILTHAKQINHLIIGERKKTIVTLDGDLYDRAVKLPNYKEEYCIRLGSLHQTTAALKCLGKYVEGSGIDLAWEASGIYGSATVRQILEGRHIYRGIEAHTITLIALFEILLEVTLPDEEKNDIFKTMSKLADTLRLSNDLNKKAIISEARLALAANDISKAIYGSKGEIGGMRKFLLSYMKQVHNLLNFIAGTRSSDWNLHLAATEEMCVYFHAHDQLNYGRWTPLYLADMLELQEKDPETWKFFAEGNFTLAKHETPFTAIDPDHGIEQEHKKMKTKGGIVGITGNDRAFEKYFIIAPVLSEVVDHFKDSAGVHSRNNTMKHHELVGSKAQNLLSCSVKLISVLTRQANPFLRNDVCNLLDFSVPPTIIAYNVVNRDDMGIRAFEKFKMERMTTDPLIPFWNSQKRNNYSYFSGTGVEVKTKVKGKLVTLKQERHLFTRLFVVAKARPEFCPQTTIGEYEFNIAPPSNFNPDGSMIMLKGKHQLVKLIEDLPLPDTTSDICMKQNTSGTERTIMLIDGMFLVNLIKKDPEMTAAKHFAKKFLFVLEDLVKSYDEFRLLFDQYKESSLKEATRNERAQGHTPIHFHVNDETPIKSIQEFLAHSNTKSELTKYLGDKVITHFKGRLQNVLVAYHNLMLSNCTLSDMVSMPEMLHGKHSLEEADQLILLHAMDVGLKYVQCDLVIFANDTDILILLIGFFNLIPESTVLMRTHNEKLNVKDFYLRLGKKRSEAIIGWYAFKGTDNTGSFATKGVKQQFSAFMAADNDILDEFAAYGSEEVLQDSLIRQMERFMCILYRKAGSISDSINDLRWTIFAQTGKEGRQLPPTKGTLIPHIHRAYYMALTWKMSVTPCPYLPLPTDYYWTKTEEGLKPVMCINPPAPQALMELQKCGCRASDNRCGTSRCKCFASEVCCTNMCGCQDLCLNL